MPLFKTAKSTRTSSSDDVVVPDHLATMSKEEYRKLQLRGLDEDPGKGKLVDFDETNTTPTNDERGLFSGLIDASTEAMLYHGTKDENLSGPTGILKSGFDPDRGGTGAGSLDDETRERCKKKVHLSENWGRSEEYANWMRGGTMAGIDEPFQAPGASSVLRVTLPKDMKNQLQQDPDDPCGLTSDFGIGPEYIRDLRGKDPGTGDWMEHELMSQMEIASLLTHLDPNLKDHPILKDDAALRQLYSALRQQEHPWGPGKKVVMDKPRL